MSRRFEFISAKDKRGTTVLDYGRYRIANKNGQMGKRIHKVGSAGFRNQIKRKELEAEPFGYRLTENNRVVHNTFERIGRAITENVLKNIDGKDMVQFDISIYVTEEAFQRGKFRKNPFAPSFRLGRGSGKVYKYHNRSYMVRTTARRVQDFLRRFGNPWKGSRQEAFDYFFDTFLPELGGVIDLDRAHLASIRQYVMVFFDNFRVSNDNPLHFLKIGTAYANDSLNMFYNCGEELRIRNEKTDAEKPFVPMFADDTESCSLPKGCWYFILIKTYKTCFDKFFGRSLYHKKVLCVEWLWKFFHKEQPLPTDLWDADAWKLNWEQACTFFQYIRVKAVLYNFKGDIVETFEPEKTVNTDMSPEIFRCIFANHHVDVVTDLKHINRVYQGKFEVAKKFQQKYDPAVDYSQKRAELKYAWVQKRKEETQTIILDQLDDIFAFVDRKQDAPSKEKWDIITNLDLKSVFVFFLKYNYQCNIYMKGASFSALTIKHVYNRDFRITNLFNKSCGAIYVESVEQANGFQKYLLEGQRITQHIAHESQNNEQFISFFEKYRMGGLNGHFDQQPFDGCPSEEDLVDFQYQSLDFNRMYTSILRDMKMFPVFDVDCYFEDYDGSPVDEYTQYWVERLGEEFVYPFHRRCLCYGMNLKGVSNIRILKMRRPIRLVENSSGSFLETLYSQKILPDDMKKAIPNVLCGQLIQKNYVQHSAYFTRDRNEISYIQSMVGGSYLTLYEGDQVFGYVIHKHLEQPLLNGFTNIGYLLLDLSYKKMHSLLEDMRSCGLKPYGIQTDAVYFTGNFDDFSHSFPHYFDYPCRTKFEAIGKLKYEVSKEGMYFSAFVPNTHDTITIQDPVRVKTLIGNEYDTEEFKQLILSHPRFLLQGHGGMGKTEAFIRALRELPFKFVVLVKTVGLQIQKIEEHPDLNCMTADSFFRLNPKRQLPAGSPRVEDYQVVLFDDWLLYDKRLLRCMHLLMNNPRYSHIKFLGTADHCQIDFQLQDCNYFIGNELEKLDLLPQRLFQNYAVLKVNKRLSDERQKDVFGQIVHATKTSDYSLLETIMERECNVIRSFKDIPSDLRHVIVSENKDVEKINRYIFQLDHPDEDMFSVGHTIMAKETIFQKGEEILFRKHERTTILRCDKKTVTLSSRVGDVTFPSSFLEKFIYPYSSTCHSWQGQTNHGKVLIVGWNQDWITTRWIGTALGRVSNLKNAYVFLGKQEISNREIREANEAYIESLYIQDVSCFRIVDQKYFVDRLWCIQHLKDHHYVCPGCFEYMGKSWSVDRIDSSLPHYKGNCRVMCVKCNIAKKDSI